MNQTNRYRFLFLLLVFVIASMVVMSSPSLAQDNQTSPPKEKKVYTNEDLQSPNGKATEATAAETPTQNPPATRQSKSRQPATNENGKDANGHDREYWQKRSRTLHDKLSQLGAEIDSLEKRQKEQQSVEGLKVSRDGHLRMQGENKQIADRLQKAKQERAGVLRQIDEMEDEARKAGAPPGWLR